ncbi:DEKNAAC100640 [Brettanomyces naardenensis]|uniref:Patatin-like phospholipase domain-containing protein n=1 Tax=Brettanomyces naardenensis TaxID=13370 RepID=A0A448YGF5_BRENA|nr:DEKNAAC100640 [Brettanomyces naardenensis]
MFSPNKTSSFVGTDLAGEDEGNFSISTTFPDNEVKETRYDFFFLKDNPYRGITERLRNSHEASKRLHNTAAAAPKKGSFLEGAYKRASNVIGGNSDNSSTERIKSFNGKIPKENMAKVKELLKKQQDAKTYSEWLDISIELDEILHNDKWKEDPASDLYDYQMIQSQLQELQNARNNRDYRKMIYIIRTSWRRNFAGIDNIQLYKHCYVGTKKLIEDYLAECEQCLVELVSPDCPLDDRYILEMLVQTRKNFGRMAITMSGGGTFGLTGIGVFAALFENGIFPKMVSGSSCGSIMSAIVCSKLSGEVMSILEQLFEVQFEVFGGEDEPETPFSTLGRFLKYGVCFDNRRLKDTIKMLVGDITFKEAYNKTGRILNITVSPASIHDQPTLLNYLTAPNVLIWSAICASCSLPFIFPPSIIYEKDFKTGMIREWSNPMVKFVDGSVNGDLPITRLSEMFNVNHVIACQANPHILPLVRFSMECDDQESRVTPTLFVKRLLKRSFTVASWEITHYLDIMNEIGIFPNACTKVKQLFLQPYRGDITILPNIKLENMSVLFANPTPDFLWNCIIWGAKATWPKLRMIKDHCCIEFALDKYIAFLKSRMITSSSRAISTGPLTLLDSDILPLEEDELNGPRLRRERSFRNRSETVSYYYFQSEESTPKMRHASHDDDISDRPPESPHFSPKQGRKSTGLRHQSGRAVRKRYSSSTMSLRKLNQATYQLPELAASPRGSPLKARRHSAEMGRLSAGRSNYDARYY